MAVITIMLLLLGCFFILVASIGVLRMPDVFTRIHTATKAGTVGLSALLLAVAFSLPELSVVSRVIGTMLFIFITAPVAAHLLGKAMLNSGYRIWHKPSKKQKR